MEMHQLRYMVAVARHGNFSRAAAHCHVSQPSLSQQIQKLEEELEARLFDRRPKGAQLTAQGEAFLPRAIRILGEAESAMREAAEGRGSLRGTVTLGVLPTIAPYLLPPVLAAFARKYPDVKMVIEEDTTARLVAHALEYQLDFVLASLPLRDERLQVRELFTEDLLVALPPGHALASQRTIRAADLEGENLIVMKEGHCLGDQVLRFCERNDLRPQISFRSAQLETVQALVCHGLGLALVPAMALLSQRGQAPVYRPMATPRPERVIVALWPKLRAPGRAAEELLRVIAAMTGKGRAVPVK